MEKAQRLLETHLEMIRTHSAFCIRSPPSPIFLKGLFEKSFFYTTRIFFLSSPFAFYNRVELDSVRQLFLSVTLSSR